MKKHHLGMTYKQDDDLSDRCLVVHQLSKRYGNQRVIDNLSFTLRRGERLAIFAPSGAGKTTLLKILSGLEVQDSGSFQMLDAAPVTLFQEPRLFPFMTVEENIYLPLKAQGKPLTPAIQRNVRRWLALCELEPFQKHYPYQLSGGMKQKTALVRAMFTNPALVMMDEPFQSIGEKSRQTLIQHLLDTRPDLTLLFVSHNPAEINQLAHTVLVFEQQALVAQAKEIKLNVSHSYFVKEVL